jgi:hypothetical protein
MINHRAHVPPDKPTRRERLNFVATPGFVSKTAVEWPCFLAMSALRSARIDAVTAVASPEGEFHRASTSTWGWSAARQPPAQKWRMWGLRLWLCPPKKKGKIVINHWILGHQRCSDKAIYHWDWGQALHANYRCIALTENLQGTHGFLQSNAVKVGNDPPLWLISHDVLSQLGHWGNRTVINMILDLREMMCYCSNS